MKNIRSNFKKLLSSDLHFRELVKGGSTSFTFQVTSLAISFLTSLLIAHLFGAAILGTFSLSLALLSLMLIISCLGLDSALVKFLAQNKATNRDRGYAIKRKASYIVSVSSILLSVVLFNLADAIAGSVFHSEDIAHYLRIMSLAIFPSSLIIVNAAAFRGIKQIKLFSFINVTPRIFHFFLIVLIAPFLLRTDMPFYTYLAGTIIGAALSQGLWFLKEKNSVVRAKAASVKTTEILKTSLPMLTSSSMFFLMQWTDTILIGVFRDESDVGHYSVALRYAILASIALIAVNSIAAPKIAELYEMGNMKELAAVVRQSTKIIFWTSLPVILVIALLSPYLLGLFGQDFKVGQTALILLLMGYFVSAISGSVGFILQMTGKQNVFQVILLSAAVINIVLNIILVPIYGISGASFATMTSMIFWNLTAVIYIRLNYGFTSLYFPMIFKK